MMTVRMKSVLDLIESSPKRLTYQEMARHLGLKSKSGVCRVIRALEERGKIQCAPERRSRDSEIVRAAERTAYFVWDDERKVLVPRGLA